MQKELTACRVCGSTELKPYLDLGMMPLSNNLLNHWTDRTQLYPLKVLLCENCGLSQLSVVIDPQTLFGHYVYRSSMSETYKHHCWKMARDLKDLLDLNQDSFHIDIAGNDGALLEQFKILLHHKALNVDPAENLEKYNANNNIRYYKEFWGMHAAQHLAKTEWPKANLITATNVFAHVDNVREFLLACDMALAKDGMVVMEFPYLGDFIDKVEFDTVYFEHLSYFSISPLNRLCEECGLKLITVGHTNIHGGSVRCFIASKDSVWQIDQSVSRFINKEKAEGYKYIGKYKTWADKVANVLSNFRIKIQELVADNQEVWAFAASAKGNILLNAAQINFRQIHFIVDQTPEKLGKFSPGTGIPIVPLSDLALGQPDYLVILSWNFADEIIDKCKTAGYKGKFILPLTFEII